MTGRKVGLHHSQLRRFLLVRKPYRVRARIYDRLRSHVLPLEALELLLATGELEDSRQASYERWLQSQTGSLDGSNELRGTRITLALFAADEVQRLNERRALRAKLERHFPELFAGFEREMEKAKSRVSPNRRELAYERVLAPFLDAESSWGIEIQWEELLSGGSPGNRRSGRARLRRVLQLGMTREILLLDRSTDEERAAAARVGLALGARPGTRQERMHNQVAASVGAADDYVLFWSRRAGRLQQLTGDAACAWQFAEQFLESYADMLRKQGIEISIG